MRFTEIILAASVASGALAEFIFTGANEAGGEFGEANLPGQLGKDYIWPDTAAIDASRLYSTSIATANKHRP